MNNKIYSMLLISALIIGANAVNNSAIGSEEFPELLPTSAVDVRRMMNIVPDIEVKKANEKDIVEVSNKNLDKKALEKKTDRKSVV